MKGYTKRIAFSLLCSLLPFTGHADDELTYEFQLEVTNPEYRSGTTRTVLAGDTFISNVPYHDGDSIAEGGLALTTPVNQFHLTPHESIASTRYGHQITLGNDSDGDGDRELLVTAPSLLISPDGGECGDGLSVCGAVFAFNVNDVLTATTQMPTPIYTLLSTEGTNFGESLQYIEQNGKQVLAVGSPGSNLVELFDLNQMDSQTNAPLKVSTAQGCAHSDFGLALNLVGDLDGDGFEELGIGAPAGLGSCYEHGAAHLMKVSDGTLTLLPNGILIGNDSADREFGSALSSAGAGRVAVGDRKYSQGWTINMGRVSLFERQSDLSFDRVETLLPSELFENLNFTDARLGTSLQYLEGIDGSKFLHIGGDGNATGEDGNQFLNNGSLLVARLEDQSHTQKAMLYEVGRFDELKYGQTSQLETLDLIPGAQSVATFAPQFNESEGMGYMRIHTVASSEPQLLSPAYGGRGTGTPCYFYQNDTGTHGSGAPENLINPSVTVAIPAPVIGEEWKHNYITVGGHPYPNSPDIEIRPFILSFWAKSLAPNPLPISPDGRCSWEIDLVDASSKNQWTYNDLQDAPQPMGNGEMVQTTLTPLDARWATIPEQINGRPADGERYYVQSLVKYFLCLEHDNPNVPSPTCVNTGLSSLTEPVAVQIGEVNAGFGIPHENLTGGQP